MEKSVSGKLEASDKMIRGKDRVITPVCSIHTSYDPMREGEPKYDCPACHGAWQKWVAQKGVVLK